MDYLFKDEEIADANLERKKFFDAAADVESNSMKLMDWPTSPDDFLDSIFSLNNDFLNELDELEEMKLNADPLTSIASETCDRTSPFSIETESEADRDFMNSKLQSPVNTVDEAVLSPQQHYMSSSSSDSGLSSDNVDFDMNADFDLLGSDLLQPVSSNNVPMQNDSLNVNVDHAPMEVKKIPIIVNHSVPQKIIIDQKKLKENPIIGNKRIEFIHTNNTSDMVKPKIQILKRIPSNSIIEQTTGIKLNDLSKKETPGSFVVSKANGNLSGIRKVIHIKKAPNPKSILLPVSLKNGTDIRSIKIIKSSALTKSPKVLMAASNLLQEYKQHESMKNNIAVFTQTAQEQRYDDSMSDPSDSESYKFEDILLQDNSVTGNDEGSDNNLESSSEYPKLILSNEEKRLLLKEGISLPAHYPLTKHEERELKRIRRKIRNKISAQDSRKRKKEYVDGLEERVKKCTDENQTLLKRIKLLQNQNQNLINQMKKMQTLLAKGTNKTAQPATCLMVLLLSMALIAAPSFRLNNNTKDIVNSDILMEENLLQNRRNLLFDTQEKLSDALVDEEMPNDYMQFYTKSENNEHDYAEIALPMIGKEERTLIDFDVDDTVWVPPNKTDFTHNKHVVDSTTNDNTVDSTDRKSDLVYDTKQILTQSIQSALNDSTGGQMTKNLEKNFDLGNIGSSDIIKLTADTNTIDIDMKNV